MTEPPWLPVAPKTVINLDILIDVMESSFGVRSKGFGVGGDEKM
jgi:hypothetical protein